MPMSSNFPINLGSARTEWGLGSPVNLRHPTLVSAGGGLNGDGHFRLSQLLGKSSVDYSIDQMFGDYWGSIYADDSFNGYSEYISPECIISGINQDVTLRLDVFDAYMTREYFNTNYGSVNIQIGRDRPGDYGTATITYQLYGSSGYGAQSNRSATISVRAGDKLKLFGNAGSNASDYRQTHGIVWNAGEIRVTNVNTGTIHYSSSGYLRCGNSATAGGGGTDI